jgi:glycosyltransferase involved in cell wall biosynthesis
MILNRGMAEGAASAGFEPQHLLWMPNPVDTDRFAPCDAKRRWQLGERFGIPASAPVVIFVGRLAPEKELQPLIRAFATSSCNPPQRHRSRAARGQRRHGLTLGAVSGDTRRILVRPTTGV